MVTLSVYSRVLITQTLTIRKINHQKSMIDVLVFRKDVVHLLLKC